MHCSFASMSLKITTCQVTPSLGFVGIHLALFLLCVDSILRVTRIHFWLLASH